MHQRMDDGPHAPNVILLRHDGDLGADPLVCAAAPGRLLQGREAEIAEDDLRHVFLRRLVAEEDVARFDVAVDDAFPADGRDVRRSGLPVVAVVQEGDGVGELEEDVPDEHLRDAGGAVARLELAQVAALAVFEVEHEGGIPAAVTVEEVRVVETEDAGVGRQYVLEDELFDGDTGAVHVEFPLLLADEDFPVADALDDPDLALAAFADFRELIVLVLDFVGVEALVVDDCSFVEDLIVRFDCFGRFGCFGRFLFFGEKAHCCGFITKGILWRVSELCRFACVYRVVIWSYCGREETSYYARILRACLKVPCER